MQLQTPLLVLLVLSLNLRGAYLVRAAQGKRSILAYSDASGTLVPREAEMIPSIADLTDGVYSLELAAVRPDCVAAVGSRQNFLGFNNRTCSTSLLPQTTAGPVMRAESKSELWYDWLIRVVSVPETGSKVVTMKAFVDPDVEGGAKCLGYLDTFYGNPDYTSTCSSAPYGNGMFLNAAALSSNTSSQAWMVVESGQEGEFEVLASSKPEECERAVAVKDCAAQPVLVDYPMTESTGKTHTVWKLIKKYDLVPNASPSPSPPPPPMVYPGPVISAPRSTTTEYVNVLIQSFGGNALCSVESINITSRASEVGSIPNIVQVPTKMYGLGTVGVPVLLKGTGYNSIEAIGRCSSGEVTAMSNELIVFYLIPNPNPV